MGEKDLHADSLGHRTTEIAGTDASGDRARSGTLPQDWRPSLEPDTVLAGRYRIARFLARGGMGEVYEAEDLVLRMRVALKAIAPELVADEKMIDRLKQEVLLARKVTHANVCRLHDLGFDAGPERTTAFLTMDLLRGHTLAAHIARRGRLTTREALPLVRQFGGALEAAHEAGVIHRDFKSRNVMLVPGTGSVPTRAVVMDFGIALATEAEEQRALDDGRLLGTPAYMAPEQMRKGEITRAADVYALGVVLFEMVTGTLPFEDARLADLISSRLTKPPPSPRARVRTLDRAWDAVILKCLALEPRDRFGSVREVVEALDTRRASVVRKRIAVGFGIVATLAAAGAWSRARAAKDVAAGAPGRRPSLAIVLSDRGASDDTRWLATALTGTLGAELDADEAMRVIPANRVTEAKRDLVLADDAIATAPALAQLRARLGVDYVAVGSYVASADGAVRVELALEDARTGTTVTTASSKGTSGKLFDLALPLAATVRKELGARAPSEAQIVAARASTAADPYAMRAYAEGRERLESSDYEHALAHFERAVTLDPSFALAHDGLARAARRLGLDARALEESRRAFELSRGLSREEQLRLEELYRETAKDWERATAIARALVEFYPDNVEYGLSYGRALVAAGKPTDALAEAERLHRLPAPDGEDPRIDLNEARAASKTGDSKRVLAAARRATEKAQRTGQESLLAEGHDLAGYALRQLRRPAEAFAEIEAARALYVKVHDRRYETSCLRLLSKLKRAQNDAVGAKPLLEQALAIARDIGDRYIIAASLNELEDLEWILGDDDASLAAFDESRGIFEAIHDRDGVAWTLRSFGYVLMDRGELARAGEKWNEARTLFRAVEQRSGAEDATLLLAQLAIVTGDRAAALRELADGEALAKELEDEAALNETKRLRALLALDDGDRPTARRLAEEARDASLATGEAVDAEDDDVLLARLAVAEGRGAEAEALARKLADDAHAGGRKNDEAHALSVLAAALVAQAKLDEARATLERAAALAPTRMEAQLRLALARAGVLAATPGGGARARELLRDTEKRARAAGFGEIAREANRAPGRVP